MKTPTSGIASSLNIDKDTATAYHKRFRNYMQNNVKMNKIGGRNTTVEIDETKTSTRKYNRGHKVEGVRIIGGIERNKLKNKIKCENKKSFFIPIEKRDATNIDDIIKKIR